MLATKPEMSTGATAPFSIHVAFVEAEWYLDAIFESGKRSRMAGESLS